MKMKDIAHGALGLGFLTGDVNSTLGGLAGSVLGMGKERKKHHEIEKENERHMKAQEEHDKHRVY